MRRRTWLRKLTGKTKYVVQIEVTPKITTRGEANTISDAYNAAVHAAHMFSNRTITEPCPWYNNGTPRETHQ